MATKKTKQSKKRPAQYHSFVRAAGPKPFVNFRFTQQTVYWTIIGMLILALGAWVMYLTIRVQNVYDAVDHTNRTDGTVIMQKR